MRSRANERKKDLLQIREPKNTKYMYDTNQFKLLEANPASKIVPNRIHDHKSYNPPRNFSKTKKLLGKVLSIHLTSCIALWYTDMTKNRTETKNPPFNIWHFTGYIKPILNVNFHSNLGDFSIS